ncbi:hypothetical protein D3C85_1324980 [compost metagenome]
MNDPGRGAFGWATGTRGLDATRVPRAPKVSMICASDKRSYAACTVPRATPRRAARSCHEGSRVPGVSTPESIALAMLRRICSDSGSLAFRSRRICSLESILSVHTVVESWQETESGTYRHGRASEPNHQYLGEHRGGSLRIRRAAGRCPPDRIAAREPARSLA